MIEQQEFFGLNHYRYGEAYFGSHAGMRYRLAADPLKRLKPGEAPDGLELLATVWPEPYAYSITEDEAKTSQHFPFSEEGLQEAVAWFNERYDADRERWEAARDKPWTEL
ncbi:MAG: hypothetical protein K6G16_02255 [Lachnospiraceae bacterium]|nr:hypothetical protein [Lachnospiraceae bacterium]